MPRIHFPSPFLSLALIGTLAIAGCAQQGGQSYSLPALNKQTIGGVVGAVGGAAAGSQFGQGSGNVAAVAAGTLLGAYLGSEVGASLDRADAAYAQRSAVTAFDTGQTATWRNPNSGNYGTVTPEPYYTTKSGNRCREFQQTITVDGRAERAFGTACRQPDGSWRIV